MLARLRDEGSYARPQAWEAVVHFAVRAGVVQGDPEIDRPAGICRRDAGHGAAAKDAPVREVELSDLYASAGFRADFDMLLTHPEMSMLDRLRASEERQVAAGVREFAAAVSFVAARPVDDPPAGGPNLLSLAGDALQSLFAGKPQTEENHRYARHARFPAAAVAMHLGRDTRFRGGEVGAARSGR